MTLPDYEILLLKDDGVFPNNEDLPVIHYQQVFGKNQSIAPQVIEKIFTANLWIPSWRNGIFPFHHYHSTAHEALGIYSGWVKVRFGGRAGTIVSAKAGDVILVPAGVSHKNCGQSDDFAVAGAYPAGQPLDMKYGKPGERPQADINIQNVSMPEQDPVSGKNGLMNRYWNP